MKRDDLIDLIDNNLLCVSVKAGAPENEVAGVKDGVLLVRINALPERGKANKELVRFFKKKFKLNVRIRSGESSRKKVLEVLPFR